MINRERGLKNIAERMDDHRLEKTAGLDKKCSVADPTAGSCHSAVCRGSGD